MSGGRPRGHSLPMAPTLYERPVVASISVTRFVSWFQSGSGVPAGRDGLGPCPAGIRATTSQTRVSGSGPTETGGFPGVRMTMEAGFPPVSMRADSARVV